MPAPKRKAPLWKAKSVVASETGGIPLKILHGVTGLLCRSPQGYAYRIRYLLAGREEAASLGRAGREWVREQFIVTRNLKRWLLLWLDLERPCERVINLA